MCIYVWVILFFFFPKHRFQSCGFYFRECFQPVIHDFLPLLSRRSAFSSSTYSFISSSRPVVLPCFLFICLFHSPSIHFLRASKCNFIISAHSSLDSHIC